MSSNAKPQLGLGKPGWGRFCLNATFIVLLFTMGGCAAIPIATIGTVAGITSSALSTGREVFTLGKLDSAELAWYPGTIVAVRQAAEDLQLKPKGKEKLKDFTADMDFIDDKNATVSVHIDRRTDRMIWLRIDVGFFGSEVTARLFLSRLRFHLPGGGNPGASMDSGDGAAPPKDNPINTTGPPTRPNGGGNE